MKEDNRNHFGRRRDAAIERNKKRTNQINKLRIQEYNNSNSRLKREVAKSKNK